MPNVKKLVEKRNALVEEMQGLIKAAQEETRALKDEENSRFGEIKAEIASIDQTIKSIDEAQEYETRALGEEKKGEAEETRALEERFIGFLRGEETRAALDIGNNGTAIIPAHIANKIIETVKELSPIYSKVTVYNVGGDLIFPVWLDSFTSEDGVAHGINASYVGDMEEITPDSGKFTTVRLENNIIRAATKVSRSLINRTDVDVFSFIVNKLAEAFMQFLERELVRGTPGKMQGALSAKTTTTTASPTTITSDELIDLQMSIPEVFQRNACWLMHKNTLKMLRKLKDSTGGYLLNNDVTTAFGWSILGRPVYFTESMPQATAGADAIVYGDLSGIYLKFAQHIELQVLVEQFALQYALGVTGYVECDSKIIEPQKLAKLQMNGG